MKEEYNASKKTLHSIIQHGPEEETLETIEEMCRITVDSRETTPAPLAENTPDVEITRTC